MKIIPWRKVVPDEKIAGMPIAKFFDKDGRVAKFWNSPFIGVPLWLMAAYLTSRWLHNPPSPGKAIGALAVVAGLMSVRDIKVLGKIAWVMLLIYMLKTEFRAIDKDRAENDRKRSDFFDAQKSGFAATVGGLNVAIAELQRAISGIDSTLRAANTTLLQTRPKAYVHAKPLSFANEPQGHFQANTQYDFNVSYVNDGNEDATIIKKLMRIYVGKPDDGKIQEQLAAKFNGEWIAANAKAGIKLAARQEQYWTESKVLSQEEVKSLKSNTLYFISRIEYSDSTGRWFSDHCEHFQADSKGIYIHVTHPCISFGKTRYKATRQ